MQHQHAHTNNTDNVQVVQCGETNNINHCLLCFSATSEKAFIKDKLASYENAGVEGRPVKNMSLPVRVDVSFSLIQIHEFDRLNQYIVLTGWLTYVSKNIL